MAEQPVTRTETPEQPKPASRGSSWLLRACVLAFMLVVILGECLVAYHYLHSDERHSPPADAHQPERKHEAQKTAEVHGEHGKTAQTPQIEMDLGDFSVTIFQPASNTTLRIDFHLFGAIRLDNEAEFRALMEEHKHRFRDQVLITIRSSDVSDLADPGLGLIKRKILAKTNETLGKPLLRSVIFSEFSFIEQ
jgi:flagellar basal body-associated protein FliL